MLSGYDYLHYATPCFEIISFYTTTHLSTWTSLLTASSNSALILTCTETLTTISGKTWALPSSAFFSVANFAFSVFLLLVLPFIHYLYFFNFSIFFSNFLHFLPFPAYLQFFCIFCILRFFLTFFENLFNSLHRGVKQILGVAKEVMRLNVTDIVNGIVTDTPGSWDGHTSKKICIKKNLFRKIMWIQ